MLHTPLTIPGLVLWLDADDVATITATAGQVSQWDDKSVNGNDVTQAILLEQPIFIPNGINGKGAISFVGASAPWMGFQTVILETDMTAIAVFSTTESTGNGLILGHLTTNNQILRVDPDHTQFGTLFSFDGANQARFDFISPITGRPLFIQSEFEAGVAQRLYLDGVLKDTTSYNGTIKTNILGRLEMTASQMGGRVGEVLIYDRILGANEQLLLNDYIRNKWGSFILPLTSPPGRIGLDPPVIGGSGVDVEDEGSVVNTAGIINFVGAGVTAADAGGGEATVTIPGGSSPDASTTVKGIVELATNAETKAGTDTTRATTPDSISDIVLPPGGASGQVLSKISGTDYDADWIPGGGAETLYVQTAGDLTTAGETIIGVTDTTSPRIITISTADITNMETIGRPITINDESGAAETQAILIHTEGSETIDGELSTLIADNYGALSLYSDGSDLFSIADVASNTYPPEMKVVITTSEIEALATGGIITVISGSTLTIELLGDIITPTRFVVESNAQLNIISPNGSNYSYAGIMPFLTSTNGAISIEKVTLVSAFGGIFLNFEGSSAVSNVFLTKTNIVGFELGTVKRSENALVGPLVALDFVSIIERMAPLVIENLSNFSISQVQIIQSAATTNAPVFDFTSDTIGIFRLATLAGNTLPGEAVIRIAPDFISTGTVLVSECAVAGSCFDSSGSTGTFTAVADAAIAVVAVAVTDNNGIAQFNHAGTDPFVGQTVTLANFATETTYNTQGVVTVSFGGSFQVATISFEGSDIGDYSASAIELTSAAHGLSNGDGLSLDTDSSTMYDGGFKIFNVQTNTFEVSVDFFATETGIWSTKGLDQTDIRVIANNNPGIENSHYLATAFVNNNNTTNPAISNNTFTNMAFGTPGSALMQGSTIQRWKLINEVTGEFEYTGNEPFDGSISFDFTSSSSGGTTDFRYKWIIDTGSGFGDLDDPVEALVSIGSDPVSITKTFPLRAVKGDMIMPQITRNSGASGITTRYATIFATQT